MERERECIGENHLSVVRDFLNGNPVRGRQRSLGFWAYDFKYIPVETISAIYERFLENEDREGKRASRAFYTPRFLAEMTLDIALEGRRPLRGKRYLDPACGSGIFLVLLFNRLVAEWRASLRRKPTPQERAEVLLEFLTSLCGVDKNLTACQITCFSLYLAFLDQFDPPDVKSYRLETGKRLPNLLRRKDARRGPATTVVWEEDFLKVADRWEGQVDVLVGNPPWAGRGSKQIANRFMETAPCLLSHDGSACLLLPSKVFLNRTSGAFQSRWLTSITLEKVVQLADYRYILFKAAKCPCAIARFTAHRPDVENHEIEYLTPKVLRTDLRDGVITIAPRDRKWIPLRSVLVAADEGRQGVAWKSRLWGTPRDLKLLDYLCTFPRLRDRVDLLSETRGARKHAWVAGQGCKPWKQKQQGRPDRELSPMDDWSSEDPFVTGRVVQGLMSPGRNLCPTLKQHFDVQGYVYERLYSKPAEALFTPPLVLFNQGFSDFAYFEFTARFQDSLQSIAGPQEDAEAFLFLTAFLRSKLARYFIFHTATNIATERDKAHLFEVLRLPFFLPQEEGSMPRASGIFKEVTAIVRSVREQSAASEAKLAKRLGQPNWGPLFGGTDDSDSATLAEWLRRQREETHKAQEAIDPLICEYFGLNKEERFLVDDTCTISDLSDTPPSLEAAKHIPTLKALQLGEDLRDYAVTLTESLNEWATGGMRAAA